MNVFIFTTAFSKKDLRQLKYLLMSKLFLTYINAKLYPSYTRHKYGQTLGRGGGAEADSRKTQILVELIRFIHQAEIWKTSVNGLSWQWISNLSAVFQTCHHWWEAKHSSMDAITGWVPVSREAQEPDWQDGTTGPKHSWASSWCWSGRRPYREKPLGQNQVRQRPQAWHRQGLALVGGRAQAGYMAQDSRDWTQKFGVPLHAKKQARNVGQIRRSGATSVLEPVYH